MNERDDARLALLSLDDDRLGRALAAVGGALAVPAAAARPDFAARIAERINLEAPRQARARWRPTWPIAPRLRRSTALALLAALLAVAAAAAAIGFNLPGLRIIFGNPPSLPPTASPSLSDRPGATLGLGTIVTTEEAQVLVDFPLLLPTDPDLGPPDATYLRLGRVAFVWAPDAGLPPTADPRIGLLLNAFHGSYDADAVEKTAQSGTHVEAVTVDGAPGYWIAGAPHFFTYLDPNGERMEDTYRSVGQTLIWFRDGITYRLETALGRDDAIRLAASLR